MKRKLEHVWYYYKWYILTALLVIYVAADFIADTRQMRQPDAVVSIVTMSQVPEETVEKIQLLFHKLWADRNQDGYAEIEMNVYAYDGMGSYGSDAEGYAAAAVHLAAEIQKGATDLLLSDAAELMRDADSLRSYGRWRDYEALNQLGCDELADFVVYAFPEKADAVLSILR